MAEVSAPPNVGAQDAMQGVVHTPNTPDLAQPAPVPAGSEPEPDIATQCTNPLKAKHRAQRLVAEVNAGERPAVQMPDEYFPPNKILFMQNLPESATKDQLTLLFSQYPNLHDVRLIPQKKIKKANCNILLIQQSILRDAVDEIALNFLKRLNILVVKDVERDEISFLSKSPGCKPIADIEAFTADKLGYADLVEEREDNDVKVVRITGVKHRGRTVSIFAMGSKNLVVEESERFLHDALCVVRCLVEKRALIGVGGAPEIHVPAWFLSTPS